MPRILQKTAATADVAMVTATAADAVAGLRLRPSGLARLAILLVVLLAIASDQANRAGGRGTVHVGGISSATGVCVPFLLAVTYNN